MKTKSPRPPGRPRVSESGLVTRSTSIRLDEPTRSKYILLGGVSWLRKAIAAAKLPPAEK